MKIVALTALALLAALQGAAAAEFETKAGVEIRTVNRAIFDASCRATGWPVFSVVTPPAQGALDIRRAPLTLKTAVDHKNCIGATVEGLAVFYRPNPGFRGVDRFTVSRARDRGAPELTDVVVTVR